MSSHPKAAAAAAVQMALTPTREEEYNLKKLAVEGIRATAVDYGGEQAALFKKWWKGRNRRPPERVVQNEFHAEGSVAGATRMPWLRLCQRPSVQISAARSASPATVNTWPWAFFTIGLLYLDEVAIGLGHRAI